MSANPEEVIQETSSQLPTVVNLDITDKAIAELGEKYSNIPSDLKDKDNYRYVQAGINELRKIRSRVRDKAKDLKADATAWQKKVTAEAKRVDEAIIAILNPMADAKKLHDDKVKAEREEKRLAEEKRKSAIMNKIWAIKIELTNSNGQPSSYIQESINRVEHTEIDDSYEEFKEEALAAKQDTIIGLQRLLFHIRNHEHEQKKIREQQELLAKQQKELEEKQAELKKQSEPEVTEEEDEAWQEKQQTATEVNEIQRAENIAIMNTTEALKAYFDQGDSVEYTLERIVLHIKDGVFKHLKFEV